jgi:Carboxypeptidase regulatory-like domain
MNFRKICLLLFAITLLSFQWLGAQSAGTGALTGTIKDPSGAVVPNATVTLTSLDTGQARTDMTGADGTYRFSLLPPGNYRVKIEASGFKPLEVPSVTVAVTETAELDRNLEVGAQSQTVTVESEIVAVQTENSTLGTVANSQTVVGLPLNTRNYTNLLAMSAGVSANVSNATTIGKGATNMAVNGGSTGQNTYQQDGVTVNNYMSLGGVTEGTLNGTFAMPNPDAISEFKIQTSSYDAGYGRNPGANVNVITRSGTNNFHGSVFEFFRNTSLNANEWFFKKSEGDAGLPNRNPILNSNVYGGAIGGPIKKDKLFFFVNYQEDDQKNELASFSSSNVQLPPPPTAALAGAGGNRGACGPAGWVSTQVATACDAAGQAFINALASEECQSQFKPTTKVGAARSVGVSCPGGPGDIDPLHNINPIAISMMQLKLPNGSYFVPFGSVGCNVPACNIQTFSNPAGFKDHQGLGNLDYIINSKHTLSVRYVYETDPINANFPAVNALEPGNAVPGNTVSTQKTNHGAVLRLTSILSNNFVNEIHLGYQRNETVNSEAVLFHNSQVGIQDFTPGVDNLSYINIGNQGSLFDFGTHPFFGSHLRMNQFEPGDQVSWTHGKHSFRAGFEAEPIQIAAISNTGSVGQPAFGSFVDFLIGRAGCSPIAAPSLANPNGCNGIAKSNVTGVGGTTAANPLVQYDLREHLYNAFVQDDFKVTPRLTVNLGLRWELDNYPTQALGNFSTFWPSLASTVANPVLAAPPAAGSGPVGTLAGYVLPSNYTGPFIPAGVYQSSMPHAYRHHAPYDDFAPRVGFAWQPLASNKLVVRGGGGFFYDLISGQYLASPMARSNPMYGPPAAGSPAASLYNPWAIPPGLFPAGANYYGFQPRWIVPGSCPSTAGSCTGVGSNIAPTSWGQDNTVPVTYQWNLNMQWEFLPSWVVEVGYVGSHGIHQATPGNQNNGPTADGSPVSTPYNLAQLAGVGAPCVSCALNNVTVNDSHNAFLRVPNLGLGSSAQQLQTNDNYKFNSLQVTMRKQMSHGLQIQAAYSWSRGFEQSPVGINTYPYIAQVYAPEYFVRPQRLVVNYVWELPFGQHKGALGVIANGWSWSGVTVIQNGQPIDINDSSGGGVFGATGGAAQIIQAQYCPGMTAANVATSGSTTQRVTNGFGGGDGWINSAAFCSTPVVGAVNGVGGGSGFGNAAFGNILGPGEYNWDMSFAKSFRGLREGQSLLFRTEIFNTFNHPQFAIPSDTDVADIGQGFGVINRTAVNPRVIQLALKYSF